MSKLDAIKNSYPPTPDFPKSKDGADITGKVFPLRGEITNRAEFSSPNEIEQFVADCTKSKQNDASDFVTYSEPSHVGDEQWAWGWQSSQVIELARRGWAEGARLLGSPAVDLANAVVGGIDPNSFEMDVTGAGVDVATYLTGAPECMIEFRESETKGLSLELVVDGFTSGASSPREIFQRGIALTAAVLSLEALGVSVTVKMVKEVRNSDGPSAGKNLFLSVVLHQPQWTLDPARLSVWLGHPAWMRMVILPAESLLTGSSNHGHARDIGDGDKRPGVVHVKNISPSDISNAWKSEEAARALVYQLLSKAA